MLTSLVDIFRKLGHCSMISHYCSPITSSFKDNGPASKEPNEHPMRRDAFISHHTLYHYFRTSKYSPKVQRNDPIFKRSTSQENYLIKAVG